LAKLEADEFTDQLFELVEREVFDPEGVEKFLAEHPEYRTEFQQMKAALSLAAELPMEQPPASLDVAIFELADAGAPSTGTTESESSATNGSPTARGAKPNQSNVVQLPVSRSWGPPLAIAAVAMLVVVVGLATIGIRSRPGDGPVAEMEAPPAVDLSEDGAAEAKHEVVAPAEPSEVDSAERTTPEEKLAARPETPPEKSEPSRAQKEKPQQQKPSRVAEAKPEPPARVAQAEPDERTTAPSLQADRAKSAEAPEQSEPLPSLRTKDGKALPALSGGDATGAGTACEKRVALFEKLMASGSYKPSAQEQLDVGLCYKKLGKKKEARRWLEGASKDPRTRDRATEALKTLN
jgi:hypothetical protein